MATPLRPDISPAAGYYTTDSYDDAVNFIVQFLEEVKSIKLVIHTSAIFLKDDEEIEVHMQTKVDTILDVDDLQIQDFFGEVFAKLTNPDDFPSIAGSGMTFLRIRRWWFTIARCQPNNNVAASNRTTLTTDWNTVEVDTTDGADMSMRVSQAADTLLGCIALHHTYVPRHNRNQRRREVRRWILRQGMHLRGTENIHISELPAWHQQCGRFNLQVFNTRGNVIYQRKFNVDDTYIRLYYTADRRYKLIIKLDAFLNDRTRSVRRFCNSCLKYHAPGVCTVKVETVDSNDTVRNKEKPNCLHKLVCYADFEAYIRYDGRHIPSGYFWCAMYDTTIIKESLKTISECNDVAECFVDDICSYLRDWSFAHDVRTTNCCICGEAVHEEQTQIHGRRNFIDGAAGSYHSSCWMTPENACIIYFHNFKGYDSHLIVRALIRKFGTNVMVSAKNFEKLDVIAVLMERYRVRFLDTYNYLGSSLSKLTETVTLFRYAPQGEAAKAPFPYEWFDCKQKLAQPLPEEDAAWHSKLQGTQQDKTLAFDIYQRRGFTEFEQYHNYYLRLDVLLLADVFELFRHNAMRANSIDPVYFQGIPVYTWYCAIQHNPNTLKIIPNLELYSLIQKNIRGGVSQCVRRYAKVERDDQYILYLDVNALYSKVMTCKLPTSLVGRLDELPENWLDWTASGGRCFIALVDLTYPTSLHDTHVEFPLAPEHYENRLCTTLLDKEEYLVHSCTLQYYVRQGLVISKVHAVWIFEQDTVFKSYVETNIRKRQEYGGNKALSDMFKLLNNSLYGKTLENAYRYRRFTVRNATDEGPYGRINSFLSSVKNFLEVDQYFLCEIENNLVRLDKPVQLGFAILELAKLEVYRFFFELKRVFADKLQLLYHDTDSLIMFFRECDEHPLLTMFKDDAVGTQLDYEKAPSDYVLRTRGTDKVPGLWSDQVDFRTITEYVGLRAKTYAIRFHDGDSIMKNKGIKTGAVVKDTRQKVNFDHYKKCLFENEHIYVDQYLIRSQSHILYSTWQKKLALISEDRKRIVLKDRIMTLPHGYQGIKYKS